MNGIENRLDSCTVSVSPPLNSDHESFEVPLDLLRSLQVTGRTDASGAVFSGAEMIYNYERLLRQVTYTNRKPAYYLNRQFGIVCSEMGGRFVSNEYQQTLTVVHPKAEGEEEKKDDAASAEAAAAAVRFQQPGHAHRALDEQTVDEVGFRQFSVDRGVVGAGVAHSEYLIVVVVVAAAVVVFLLVLSLLLLQSL